MKALLPLLLVVLICPVAMVIMMRWMHGHGPRAEAEKDAAAEKGTSTAELRRLRQDLEQRMGELDARLADLEASGSGITDVRVTRR